ncbi:MAG: hypothetical protein CMG66_01755 [Candidatus Marinimicrobia bacterium]|nr:hypothetical protein [Candidatus Neomarinimicrobiota bacterium]|tara:strand:- start:5433 stop:6080 length:648 start_codon:yes stop_codon:yes gene_type:complete
MSIQNIVWDWNGTIVNDAQVFVDTMNFLLASESLPLTHLQDYRQNFVFPVEQYWKHLGFSLNTKEFNKKNSLFIKQYQKNMFVPLLHPGIKKLIGLLNAEKIRQFVLSASENSLLQQSIKHYKLTSLFVDCFGVKNLNAKGKELLGKKLFKKHFLNNKKTLLIGDTEYDARVADALGCPVVLVSYGHINHNRLSKTNKTVVASVKELSDFIFSNQ